MKLTDKIMETLRNVQIRPSKIRVEVNDKTSKNLFSLNKNGYEKLLNGKKGGIIEKRNHKKHGKIITRYGLKNLNNYDNTIPLSEFDRAVLNVCHAERLAGNNYTTPAIIFRALVGKVGEVGISPTPAMKQKIMDSIRKLMFTEFNSDDIAESYKILKYANGDELKYIRSAILPCCLVQAKINGQIVDAIFFDRESPLFTIAELKSQIVRYDNSLLDVPNMNNTPLNIALKNYVIRRVIEIKLHKQLVPTITFDDVYKKCGIENASKKVKFDARATVVRLFEHLLDNKFIDSFDTIKAKSSNKIYSISFTFTPDSNNVDNSSKKDSYSNSVTSYSNSVTSYSNSVTSYSNSVTSPPNKMPVLALPNLPKREPLKKPYTI